MNELKKGLEVDISHFVEFVAGTDEKDFEYLADNGNYDNNTSLTSELSQGIYPASGDAIYSTLFRIGGGGLFWPPHLYFVS